ncbi:MAG TPA: PadR family transcriptional regulator [Fusibacter sp.]|nr:PadR family transcriptional regulator [Fusibacter sp.]
MEYVILGLLIIQPSTLYSLNKSFEQGISLFFSPSLGSINSAIKRLMDKNLVKQEDTVENGRAKKILTITEKGQNAFFSWMHEPLDPKNLEVSFMSRLYFLGLIENQTQKNALVEGMYQSVVASKQTLDETAAVLENLDIPQSYQDIFHYQKKVLQYGIDTHGYAIEWIEKLIKEMD